MQPKFLEDLSIGDRFVSSTQTVATEQIKAFAEQFDPQSFHLDEGAAAGSIFEGLAASGWHTAAMTMRLLVGSVPIVGGLVGAGGQIQWPRPTRPGDELHVESEIMTITPSRSRTDRGTITLRSCTLNQRGEEVQILTASLVVPRRPPMAGEAPR